MDGLRKGADFRGALRKEERGVVAVGMPAEYCGQVGKGIWFVFHGFLLGLMLFEIRGKSITDVLCLFLP